MEEYVISMVCFVLGLVYAGLLRVAITIGGAVWIPFAAMSVFLLAYLIFCLHTAMP